MQPIDSWFSSCIKVVTYRTISLILDSLLLLFFPSLQLWYPLCQGPFFCVHTFPPFGPFLGRFPPSEQLFGLCLCINHNFSLLNTFYQRFGSTVSYLFHFLTLWKMITNRYQVSCAIICIYLTTHKIEQVLYRVNNLCFIKLMKHLFIEFCVIAFVRISMGG